MLNLKLDFDLIRSGIVRASVAELVDALDLGSSGEIRGGSIPSTRTIYEYLKTAFLNSI